MLYPIAIEKGDETHAYGVTVPDLPGCFSAGDTFDEALKNASEAIHGFLQVLSDDGDEIPMPSSIESYVNDERFNGYIWSVADIDIAPYLGSPHKINVTLPSRLIAEVDAFVSRKGSRFTTRSALLAEGAKFILSHEAAG